MIELVCLGITFLVLMALGAWVMWVSLGEDD